MELGEVYVKIGADIVPLEKALGKARTVTKNTTEQMRAQMKTLGTGMVIAGAAITAAFALTVRSAISFQKELAQVSTMLDDSAMKIMPQYKSELLKMSVAFGESTDTLSRGLYDILSASIPPTQALEVLAVAAKAAVAGITDTGVASDAVTTILNSYGFSADMAGEVSDKLFAIVKRGKLTFNELAPAIGKTASMAAKTGLSFDELGAMIATLTRAGIRTDEAMTSINGVLRAFLKPSNEAKEAAKGFGLEMNTTTLRTIGLKGAMDKLRNATAEQLAQIFPNIRGLKGLIAALGDVEGYTKDYELMLNSAGLTQEAFTKQSATLGFKIDQLKKSFNVVAITVGDVLIPVVQKIVEHIMNLVLKMKEWMDKHPGLTKAIVLLGAALGVMTGAGGALILGVLYFTRLNTTMKTVMGTSKTMIPVLGRVRIALNSLGGAILVAQANLIIWFEVWKEYQKIMDATVVTTENVEEAELRLAKAQEATAEKLGLTIEKFRELQEVGTSVTEMLAKGVEIKMAAADWEAYNKGLIELTKLAKEGRFSAAELYKLMQDLAKETGVLTEKTAELESEVDKIVTTVEKLQQELSLVSKEYEAYSKSVSDSIGYYGQMIEKLNQIDVILQTELALLEQGTEEWHKKKEEIADNIRLLNELNTSLSELIEPLKGLELIAAKMELLGDSTEDTKAKIELLNRKAVLLQKALDEAIPDTEAWWEAKAAFVANQTAIDGFRAKLKELTEEEKEAIAHAKKLADAHKTIEDKIYELTHTPMETAIRRLDEQKQAYIDLGVAIGVVNKWYDEQIKKLEAELNPALDDTTKKLKEAGEAGKEAGEVTTESWGSVVVAVYQAGKALTDFTVKGVAAAIATIKMKYYPMIKKLIEDINAAYGFYAGIWRRAMESELAFLRKNIQSEINTILYGFKVYNDVLTSLGGTVEDTTSSMANSWKQVTAAVTDAAEAVSGVGTATTGGAPGVWGAYPHGTPYVPRTGLYKLERGERVTPANQNTYNNTFSPILNMTVQGGGSPNRIAQEVEKVLYETGRQFKRKGFEVIPGRG